MVSVGAHPMVGRRTPLVRLGDVIEFTPRPASQRTDRPLPFLPMSAIPAGGGIVDDFELREPSTLSGGRYFEVGDFVLATITPSLQNGKQAIIGDGVPGGWGVATTEVLAMRSPLLLPEYLAYLFRTPAVRKTLLDQLAGATGRMRLPRSAVQELQVPSPSIEQQHDLVARLDEIWTRTAAGLGNLQSALDEAPRLRRSLLVAGFTGTLVSEPSASSSTRSRDDGAKLLREILGSRALEARAIGAHSATAVQANGMPDALALPPGWVWASIDQLALQLQYGTSAKASNDASGVPVLRMGNLQSGELDWNDLKYLPVDHDAFPKLLLREGDVLFNRTNSPDLVGKSAPVRELTQSASFASYLIRVALHPRVDPRWVAYWLNSLFGRTWARDHASQQVGQANINGRKLRAMAIPLPGPAEQSRICELLDNHLSKLSTTVVELGGAVATGALWRQSVLNEAFAGLLE